MTPKAVLLDLGNVVIGVNFARVMQHWADLTQLDPQHFHDNWAVTEDYRRHERGELSFHEYSQHLAELFDVEMSLADWQSGWNDIWTQPFQQVIQLLPAVAERYPLYCFTNTNQTHTTHWRQHYAAPLSHFRNIFVSNELGQRKPERVAFDTVCEQMATTPADVLFLDDSQENVRGASEAGLNAVHVADENAVVAQLSRLL